MTGDIEVRCAALLHDTVEDTAVTVEDIEKNFGKRVAALVGRESEDKSKPWLERKIHTIKHLKNECIEVKMIALGDKLSNIRASARDFLAVGDDFLLKFHEKDKQKQGMYYFGILDSLRELENSEFYREYEKLCNFVFGDMRDKI